MMRHRRAIGEALGAAIILGATGVVATIMLSAYSDQSQVIYADLRSYLDVMRAQAVEQLDVTSVECCRTGNLTFLVVNYGDHPSTMPFELYTEDGVRVTDNDVSYYGLDGNPLGFSPCDMTPPGCDRYSEELAPGGAVRLEMPWTGDPLVLVTDTGRGLWVDVN